MSEIVGPPDPRQPFTFDRPVPFVLRVGCWILIGVGVIGLVELSVTVVMFDWPRYFATSTSVITSRAILVVVLSALAFVAQIVLGWLIGRGFNWARIVSAVVAVLAVGALLVGFNPIAAIETLLTAGGVVLTFLPPSSRYIREIASARRLYRARQGQVRTAT